jgi:hypothetical protein
MANILPNPDPKSLAEKLAAEGSQCPIPATHDRLAEVHHWWHEMAHWYHKPEPFRYRVGAFIQAARNVTWMLQTEKAVFEEFGWYEAWAKRAKDDPVLKWLKDTRNDLVKQQALEPNSWLEMRCIGNPRLPGRKDKHPAQMLVSPFQCTHYYIMRGPPTDHVHEFTRHWSMDGLDGRELLEVCADVYDRLDEVVQEAHERLGAHVVSYAQPGSARRLPCMDEIKKHRVVKTRMRKGREVWINEPKGLHRGHG